MPEKKVVVDVMVKCLYVSAMSWIHFSELSNFMCVKKIRVRLGDQDFFPIRKSYALCMA